MAHPQWPPQPSPPPVPSRAPSRGVPDGLLLAGLALLVGGTTVVWLATGLAAVAGGGDWPDNVTYSKSALAMRSLFGDPGALAKAWPDTPGNQLPTPRAFWVIFGILLLILLIAAGFVFRWWLRRASRRNMLAAKRNQVLPDGE